MAISIKNHEDRITALEKKSNRAMSYGVINTDGTCTFYTNQIGVKYMGSSNFDLQTNAFYAITATMITTDDAYGLSIHSDHSKSTDSIIAMIQADSAAWQFVTACASISKLAIRNTRRSGSNIATWYDNPHNQIKFIILKLYYNFSYNITREFYKVKFKLKHYLCSHLRKFI